MPLVSQTFDQLLDFTRTTSGTFVGSNGLIQTTPASANLLLWTQQFDNAAWTKAGMTVTANSTVAPDGTSTADTLTATAGTGVSVRVSQSGTTINATVYTASFYVRPGTHTFVQIHINAQTADWCNFTLTGSGSVQNNGAAVGTISFDSATGYYRVSMTYTAGGTDRTPFFGLVPSGTATRNQTWNPVGTETVFIWGAQLEAASAATTYTRNNGGVFPPRFDYDPVTLAPKGLLIEEQRTNLLVRSEEFNTAPWVRNGVGTGIAPVLTANSAIAPNGTMTATLGVFDRGAGTSSDRSVLSQTVSVSAGTYTQSLWLKAATPDDVGKQIAIRNVGGAGYLIVNLTATWERYTKTEVQTTSVYEIVNRQGFTADTTVSLLIWGAQLEAGAFATSYIPTVASQVTRSADVATMTGTNYSSWYNPSEGSLVAEFTFLPRTLSGTAVIAYNGSSNGRWSYLSSASAHMNDGTNTAVAGSIATPTAINKTASALSSAGMAISLNGAAPGTSAYVGTFGSQNALDIGQQSGTSSMNGHMRSIRYYPTRLTNAQLQALTA